MRFKVKPAKTNAKKLKTCAACGVIQRANVKRCPICNLHVTATPVGSPNPRAEEQDLRLAKWESKNTS